MQLLKFHYRDLFNNFLLLKENSLRDKYPYIECVVFKCDIETLQTYKIAVGWIVCKSLLCESGDGASIYIYGRKIKNICIFVI